MKSPEKTPDEGDARRDRRHFLLRRLHSLSGVVPVGVFLAVHLWANVRAVYGHPASDPSTRCPDAVGPERQPVGAAGDAHVCRHDVRRRCLIDASDGEVSAGRPGALDQRPRSVIRSLVGASR